MTDASAARPTRREALRRSAAATLAAARALSPALFAGCSLGIQPRAPTVTVGLLHSQTGSLAIGATGLRDIQMHAFEQINAAGGLLGRQIEMLAPDPQSRVDLFPKRARDLVDRGAVAVFGCWTSAARKAVLPIFEAANRLLFYAVQYEGYESAKHCVYGGTLPNQQIIPALDWLATPAGRLKKQVFLLGSDSIFPRTANFIVKKYLADKTMNVAGEAYVPQGDRDFSGAVKEILASEADCVLSTVSGDSNLGLFAALAEAGVDAARLPVMTTSVSEDELRSLLPRQVQGHYAAACYFQNLDTPANRAWIEGFRAEFGYDRITGDPMEPAWCLVHLWKKAVEKAGSFATDAVRQAFRDGLDFAGPGGPVRLDPKTQHTTKFFRVGRIRADRQFDIVHASREPIDPDPYPQFAFPGWSVDWTQGGITRGAEVDVYGDV